MTRTVANEADFNLPEQLTVIQLVPQILTELDSNVIENRPHRSLSLFVTSASFEEKVTAEVLN